MAPDPKPRSVAKNAASDLGLQFALAYLSAGLLRSLTKIVSHSSAQMIIDRQNSKLE